LSLAILLLVLIIITGGTIYLRNEENRIRSEKYDELKAIADLKIEQIEQWKLGKIHDASVSESVFFGDAIADFADGNKSPELKKKLLGRLSQFEKISEYKNAFITLPDGAILLTVDSALADADKSTIANIETAMNKREIHFSEIYYDESRKELLIDIVAPVIRNGVIKALLVLQTNPATYLYPLIQRWPTPSKTAETVLVKKVGKDLLFINELRQKQNVALTLKIPLSDTNVAGVQAVMGRRGIYEGIDYRGVKVIADLRQVKGTSWFMVTKMDRSEMFAELNYRSVLIGVIVLGIILLVAAGFSLLYNNRQKNIYRELFNTEISLKTTEEEYRTLFESMLNGFAYCHMLYDGDDPVDFLYLKVNAAFETLTGLKNVTGKNVSDVIPGIRQADPGLFEIYSRVALTGQHEKFETYVNSLKDWYLITVYSPKKEYFVTIFDVITEQKRAEQELQKISTDLQLIFKNMINAFVLWESVFDENGRYVSMRFGEFNNAYAKIAQLKYEDVQGKDVFEVWPETEQSWVDVYGKVAITGIPCTFDMYHEPTKGWYHCNAYRPSESKEQVCVIFEDITMRREAEEALKENEQKFRNLFENSPVGKSMTGIDGTINVNRAFCSIVGYSEKELQEIKWMDVTHPDDISLTKDAMQLLLDGKQMVARFEKRFIHKDGKVVWTDMSSYLQRDKDGLPQYFITTIIDISERKKVEEEVEKLHEELEQRVVLRTAQLEEANKELEAFSYSVSHDLRAPLRHISGFSEILASDYKNGLPEKAIHYIDTINKAAKTMGTLIDDLLQFSRTGRAEMKQSIFEMDELFAEAKQQISSVLPQNEIQWNIAPMPVLKGDYNLLRQVWVNLLSNALKYSRGKSPQIIKIGYTEEQTEFVFNVNDNGIGFDMEYAHKLFGVFQRLHSSSQFEGTGIGLANVRRIISRHGGRTWAEAIPNQGATFYFTIPKTIEDL